MSAAARPRVVAGLRLLRQVGEGGEGEVWEARDAAGRRRALKLIRPDALVDPEEVERRGRWLLAIDHPALVGVHRCGVLAGAGLDGWGFVEMSFVDGAGLEDAPPDHDALARLEPLAEALDLLHAGRWSDGIPLVHRDVKPANLIEDADGALVLVDASTLRDVDDGTRTRIGTPLYAAPEVVTGRAGPLADVYSFAATAVALLTGARRQELAGLLAHADRLDLPEGLRAALADDPADRPVSCRAALDPSLPLIVGSEVGWETRRLEDDDGGAARDRQAGDQDDEPWLAPATEVLLDPWHDPYEDGPARVRGVPWAWLVLLAALATAPLLAWLVLGAGERRFALLGAAVVHVAAGLLARCGLLPTLLAPPLAWASLLADRTSPPGPVRSWARAALLPAITLLAAPGVLGAARLGGFDRVSAVALAGTGLIAVTAVVSAAPGGRLLRLSLSPLWIAGWVVLLAGGLLLLPIAALAGRGPALRRALGEVAGGALAFVRR